MHNEIIIYIEEFLTKLFENMNIEVNINIHMENNLYLVKLESNHNGLLIGTGGKNLEALQRLTKLALSNHFEDPIKVRIEIGNYRQKKEEQLEKKITKIVGEVENTGLKIKLDPMNSYQRRIVHEIVKQHPKLKSESYGEEPNRYIVIDLKD